MSQYILSIDIGTTSAKGVAVDRNGGVAASAQADYPIAHPQPGWVEQEPTDWWQATVTILHALWAQGVEPRAVAGVVFSGQMEDTVLVDPQGRTLGPAVLYSDGRAGAEAEAIAARVGADRLRRITGNAVDAQTTLAKLLWFAGHQPERLEKAAWVLPGSKDYVILRLTGRAVTDPTTAATTGMLAIGPRRWSTALLEELGLPPGLLPHLADPAELAGQVLPAPARETGLVPGTPVFVGVGDAGAATVGAGAIAPGRAYCYLGTTGWVATPTEGEGGPDVFQLCHMDRRYRIAVAPLLNAGSPYQWARDQVAQRPDYGEMEQLVAAVAPGSGGLVFLPYLEGERSPFRDPNARGAYLGISRTTTRAHLLRAVMEGVSYAMRHVLETVAGPAGVGQMTFIGGGSQSPTWAQILADVCRTSIFVPAGAGNAPAQAAALAAGIGLGWFSGYEVMDEILQRGGGRTFSPNPGRAAVYERLYGAYRRFYPAVRDLFPKLAAAQALAAGDAGAAGEGTGG